MRAEVVQAHATLRPHYFAVGTSDLDLSCHRDALELCIHFYRSVSAVLSDALEFRALRGVHGAAELDSRFGIRVHCGQVGVCVAPCSIGFRHAAAAEGGTELARVEVPLEEDLQRRRRSADDTKTSFNACRDIGWSRPPCDIVRCVKDHVDVP
jgi:hypothetical protein